MRRYETVLVGDQDLVLDLLRSSLPGAAEDRFALDTGHVPGTRFSKGRVEGRFERVERGIRVVAEAGAHKTHAVSTLLAGGLVLFVTASPGGAGVRSWLSSITSAALGIGVLALYHRWVEDKAADHATRRLEEHLGEIRQLLGLHDPSSQVPLATTTPRGP